MSRRATIYDVAKRAKVSITTVSRVINTPGQVSSSTRDRVDQAMRDLEFVPKAEAADRARKGFRRIGVLTPFFTEPSFVQRLRGVASALNAVEYELITYSVENAEQFQGYLVSLPVSRRVDGVIVFSLPVRDEDAHRFALGGVPVVLVEVTHHDLSSVSIDNAQGGRMVARYLYEKGYRRPAFLGEGGQPAYSLHATDQRRAAYFETWEELGIPIPSERMALHPYGMAHAMKASLGLLTAKERPDVVFATSDLQAVAVLRAARELGLRVPEDLGVMGFDDIDLADYMGLSTVRQGLDDSGIVAVDLLMERIRDPEVPVRTLSLDLEIIQREST